MASKKSNSSASSKFDPVEELAGIIEQLELKIGNMPPRSREATWLRKHRNELKAKRRKITAATFKKNTVAYQQAASNLKAVTNETQRSLKDLKNLALLIQSLSKLVLAAEQLILCAV